MSKYYCVLSLLILFTSASVIASDVNLSNPIISSCPNIYQNHFDFTFDCGTLQSGENHSVYLEENSAKFYCKDIRRGFFDYIWPNRTYGLFAIHLNNCSIPHITHKFLQQISLIHLVYLDKSYIKTIENTAIANNLNVRLLSMKHNNLTELPTLLLAHAPQLGEINFSNNQIKSFKFHGIGKKLRIVDLSDNRIEYLDQDAIIDLTNLEALRLNDNLIKYFPVDLSNMASYRENHLFLDNNQIEKVDCNTFTKLYAVHLSGNPIREIDLNCTRNDLYQLYIEKDLLEELKLPASPLVHNLRGIHVADSKINKITIEREMGNLHVLSLTNTNLTNISGILQYFHNLRTLDLSENDIREFKSDSFLKMSNLELLLLRSTNLTKIDPKFFSHLKNLTTLDLSDNKLKTFDFSSIFFEHLLHLVLKNNSLTELPNWSADKFPILEWFDISINNFNCSYLDGFMKKIPERIGLKEENFDSLPNGTKNINGTNCIDEKLGS